jgi:hypothetical protein
MCEGVKAVPQTVLAASALIATNCLDAHKHRARSACLKQGGAGALAEALSASHKNLAARKSASVYERLIFSFFRNPYSESHAHSSQVCAHVIVQFTNSRGSQICP